MMACQSSLSLVSYLPILMPPFYADMFSYYGIAASITIGIINYVLLGFAFPVDGFYMHSFEIWLATTVVFFGSGNVGYTLLEYRLGKRQLVSIVYTAFCLLSISAFSSMIFLFALTCIGDGSIAVS